MLEFLVVLGFVAAFAAFSSLFWFSLQTVLWVGVWLCAIGFVVGVPTGLLYHVRLYQSLKARDRLPAGWYWRPSPLNKELTEEERPLVMPWFFVGGVGFLVIVFGIVAMGVAMARVFLEGSPF